MGAPYPKTGDVEPDSVLDVHSRKFKVTGSRFKRRSTHEQFLTLEINRTMGRVESNRERSFPSRRKPEWPTDGYTRGSAEHEKHDAKKHAALPFDIENRPAECPRSIGTNRFEKTNLPFQLPSTARRDFLGSAI